VVEGPALHREKVRPFRSLAQKLASTKRAREVIDLQPQSETRANAYSRGQQVLRFCISPTTDLLSHQSLLTWFASKLWCVFLVGGGLEGLNGGRSLRFR
jgi:hypothetical protein